MSRLPLTRPSLLLRLRQHSDSAAWGEFLKLYGPAVFGYFRRRGLQEADAVDQTQEVFRSIASYIDRFDYQPHVGRFRGWLFTVVSRQYLKFRTRGSKLPINDAIDDLDQVAADSSDDQTWDESIRRQMFELALEQVRHEVSETTLQAFMLTSMDNLNGDDVAKRLGISRAAVYLARARVLAKLREAVIRMEQAESEL